MAVKYWDPTSGNDTTGDGSWATPYATIGKASTEAGSGGETRCVGNAITLLDNATWTKGSASVVFDSDVGLSAGDAIKPDYEDSLWYVVSSYDAPSKTATLDRASYRTTGSYATYDAGPYHTITTQMTLGAAGRTHTFGWVGDGTQGGISHLRSTYSSNIMTMQYSSLFDTTGGDLLVRSTGGQNVFYCTSAAVVIRWKGPVYVLTTGYAISITGAYVAFDWDTLYAQRGAVLMTLGDLVARRVVSEHPTTASGIIAAGNGHLRVAQFSIYGSTATYYATSVAGGHLGVGWLTAEGVDTDSNLTSSTSYGGTTHIGHLEAVAAVYTTGFAHIFAPAVEFYQEEPGGVLTLGDGRGGSGYCYKADPAYGPYGSVNIPLARPVPAGKSVQLKFWAVYTGTVADPPECYVRAIEPNGLDVTDHSFTPARTANTPGGAPDGWTDATQHTITFSGETALDAGVVVQVMAYDNVAQDALLYLDDFTWVLG